MRIDDSELQDMESSTDKVNSGMSNGGLWIIIIICIICIPVSVGLSLIPLVVCLLAMGGGPSNVAYAATPHKVDIAEPKSGCVRMSAVFIFVGTLLFLLLLAIALPAFEAGLLGH